MAEERAFVTPPDKRPGAPQSVRQARDEKIKIRDELDFFPGLENAIAALIS